MKLPNGIIVRINGKSYKNEIPDSVCPNYIKKKFSQSEKINQTENKKETVVKEKSDK